MFALGLLFGGCIAGCGVAITFTVKRRAMLRRRAAHVEAVRRADAGDWKRRPA